MKPYYSDYAKHCIRFYIRHPSPCFRNNADKRDWNACESAFNEFNDFEKKVLRGVYKDAANSVAETVNRVANEQNIKAGTVWKLIENFEREVAKERGLL